MRPNVRDNDVTGLKRDILVDRTVGLSCPVQGFPAPTFRYPNKGGDQIVGLDSSIRFRGEGWGRIARKEAFQALLQSQLATSRRVSPVNVTRAGSSSTFLGRRWRPSTARPRDPPSQ